MILGDEYETQSRTLAQRFLRTAVVVDDEAFPAPNGDDGPKPDLVAPDRNTRASGPEKHNPVGHSANLDLNAGLLIDSFSKLGIICGVVGPNDSAMQTMRQADIVILDWRLQEDDPDCALNLLRDLLTGESDRNSLRLVAIYTGEPILEDIGAKIYAELERQSLEPDENETKMEIRYRHGRVVLYAKSSLNLTSTLKDRYFAEENLPKRLVEDFAHMTEGLLPGIALTSLTAVREGSHKVLDRFSAELDPAYLAHMACLSCPEEAERQIVSHIAEELRGLADEAVTAESPAGKQAAERWIQRDGRDCFKFKLNSAKAINLDSAKTIQLVTKGLEASAEFSNSSKKKAFEFLSAGFAQPGIVSVDERLAWIMNFRTLYNAPAPKLWLGSIVTTQQDGKPRHLICITPRCDSVRLNEETSFIFLPLVRPEKKWGTQLVIKLGSEFCRMSVLFESASLELLNFIPSEDRHEVIGIKRESDDKFEFVDTDGVRYEWRGELKSEYAQRIAQNFAAMLSRQAIDESEWLRRMAKK